MRSINHIVIHCSAVRSWQQSGVAEIDRWHRSHGWKGCGYHYVIRRDGNIEIDRPLEMVGPHCQYNNRHLIGICCEFGLDEQRRPTDTRTDAQKVALRSLLEKFHAEYPMAVIVGHNVFNTMKACPCFNALAEYRNLQGV